MDDDEFASLVVAPRTLSSLPLFVDDTAALGVAELAPAAPKGQQRDEGGRFTG